MKHMFIAAALVASGLALVPLVPTTAGAAESHENCITVDDNGTITDVTPSCSETIHVTGDTESRPEVNPCTGDLGTFTSTADESVLHVSVNKDSEIWVTGTDEGTATFIPDDVHGVGGSGHWTDWFGFNLNEQTTEQTFTFDAAMHLDNGQNVTFHEVVHLLLTPTGFQFQWDKPVDSSCTPTSR